MKEISYTIKDPLGIHARPAGLLAKKAASFKSDITITRNDKTADLKKIFGIMGLGAKQGDTITVRISGEDEEEAYKAVNDFLNENL